LNKTNNREDEMLVLKIDIMTLGII